MKKLFFTLILVSSLLVCSPSEATSKKAFGSSDESYRVLVPLGLGLVS